MHSIDLGVLAEDDNDDEEVDDENEDCQTAQYADLHDLVMSRNICAVGGHRVCRALRADRRCVCYSEII